MQPARLRDTIEASLARLPLRARTPVHRLALVVLLGSLLAVQPASAQSTGTAFCQTNLAATLKNLFTVIQFGGPLIGGLIALGATVAVPSGRRVDQKEKSPEVSN